MRGLITTPGALGARFEYESLCEAITATLPYWKPFDGKEYLGILKDEYTYQLVHRIERSVHENYTPQPGVTLVERIMRYAEELGLPIEPDALHLLESAIRHQIALPECYGLTAKGGFSCSSFP